MRGNSICFEKSEKLSLNYSQYPVLSGALLCRLKLCSPRVNLFFSDFTASGIYVYIMLNKGWSGGAMVLGKLPVPGRPTIWITVGQGPTALAEGAGGGCLDIFSLIYPFFPLSPSLWETARYRLKYCLKGPLTLKPTNQPIMLNNRERLMIFFSQNICYLYSSL